MQPTSRWRPPVARTARASSASRASRRPSRDEAADHPNPLGPAPEPNELIGSCASTVGRGCFGKLRTRVLAGGRGHASRHSGVADRRSVPVHRSVGPVLVPQGSERLASAFRGPMTCRPPPTRGAPTAELRRPTALGGSGEVARPQPRSGPGGIGPPSDIARLTAAIRQSATIVGATEGPSFRPRGLLHQPAHAAADTTDGLEFGAAISIQGSVGVGLCHTTARRLGAGAQRRWAPTLLR